MAALVEALTLSCPQGYVRVFADEGPPMGALLGRLVAAHRAKQAPARRIPLSCWPGWCRPSTANLTPRQHFGGARHGAGPYRAADRP